MPWNPENAIIPPSRQAAGGAGEDEGELDRYLARYGPELRGSRSRPPRLADVLTFLAALPETVAALSGIRYARRCLLEGYAAPDNAEALRGFLRWAGAGEVEIVAVDLFDLPAAYSRLGWALPAMEYRRADACRLAEVAEDGAFDVVVQESLLNCVPPVRSAELLGEAARVLSPRGRALISVTDCTAVAGRPELSTDEVSSRLGTPWDPSCRHLSGLVSDPGRRAELLDELAGSVVVDRRRIRHTFITRPDGRFEFFVPFSTTERQLTEAGFELLVIARETGRDDNGLDCVRHRTIVRRRG